MVRAGQRTLELNGAAQSGPASPIRPPENNFNLLNGVAYRGLPQQAAPPARHYPTTADWPQSPGRQQQQQQSQQQEQQQQEEQQQQLGSPKARTPRSRTGRNAQPAVTVAAPELDPHVYGRRCVRTRSQLVSQPVSQLVQGPDSGPLPLCFPTSQCPVGLVAGWLVAWSFTASSQRRGGGRQDEPVCRAQRPRARRQRRPDGRPPAGPRRHDGAAPLGAAGAGQQGPRRVAASSRHCISVVLSLSFDLRQCLSVWFCCDRQQPDYRSSQPLGPAAAMAGPGPGSAAEQALEELIGTVRRQLSAESRGLLAGSTAAELIGTWSRTATRDLCPFACHL
eukprot:SAG22_NODE_2737_length_2263_cov_1.926063_3_plen_335_part_01